MTLQDLRNELTEVEDAARDLRNTAAGSGNSAREEVGELAAIVCRLAQLVREEIVR